MSKHDYSGKAVLVTGGASGIGEAACIAFGAAGASVLVVDRDGEGADRVADRVTQAGGKGLGFRADMANENDIAAMVEIALGRFGTLHCAFNNAGIGGRETGSSGQKTAEITREAWDRIIAVNLTAVWLCMKYEIAAMRRGGSIVNNASVGGLVALRGASAYTASKHAVVGLSRVAAAEYGEAGIRVNALCPGYVETPLIQSSLDKRRGPLETATPMGRLGSAAEIADVAVWLCSDAAAYVTGAAIAADGGYTAI